MEGCKGVALDRLRKGAGGIIGIGFVLVLIASFIIWFPAGWFQGYGTQDIITVGGLKIGPQEYMRAQQDVLRSMSAQAGRSLSLQAVSYTHLRAHETRHDLVCRLLLEKKK